MIIILSVLSIQFAAAEESLGVTLIKADGVKAVCPASGKLLRIDREENDAFIEDIAGDSEGVLLSGHEDWPILDALFSNSGDRLYICAGGANAYSPKLIIEYDTATGSPVWGYKLNGDFVSSFSVIDGERLTASIHNAGAVLLFDLENMSAGGVKIYESQCYFARLLPDGGVFVYGSDSYKDGKFSVKFLSRDLQIMRSIEVPSEGYGFDYSQSAGKFIMLGRNRYQVPDNTVVILDDSFNETARITPNEHPYYAAFSDDGENIVIAYGHEGNCRLALYSPEGELIEDIPIETDETWVRVVSVQGNQGDLAVVMGKTER